MNNNKLAQSTKMTAEERAQLIEAALKKEEARIAEIERELGRLRDVQVFLLHGMWLCYDCWIVYVCFRST